MTLYAKLFRSIYLPAVLLFGAFILFWLGWQYHSQSLLQEKRLSSVIEGYREALAIGELKLESDLEGLQIEGAKHKEKTIALVAQNDINPLELKALTPPKLLQKLIAADGDQGNIEVWNEGGILYALASVAIQQKSYWIIGSEPLKSLTVDRNRFIGMALMAFLLTAGLFFYLFHHALKSVSNPLHELRSASLLMAAGESIEDLQLEGAKEIVELANAINSIRASVKESIGRFRERTLAKELLYGEKEAVLILQDYLFERVAHRFNHPWLELETIHIFSSLNPSGLFLEIQEKGGAVQFQLSEAKEAGIQGVLELLYSRKGTLQHQFPKLELSISEEGITAVNLGMPPPMIYSSRKRQCKSYGGEQLELEHGDYLFCFNKSYFEVPFDEWFERILVHFADDGLEVVASMIRRELSFQAQRIHPTTDIKVLCIKVL